MTYIVQKFGGTSVADIDCIQNVAQRVKDEVNAGHKVAVVVSAMAGETNKLVEWANQTGDHQLCQEYDVIVSSGEQVTSGLLALNLQRIGVEARSWMGWQIPIFTDNIHGKARIEAIEAKAFKTSL
ncbi:MAG: aspartate kinase, partial [Rhodospirillaceae bacterium]|nr:aspartate kinase [Rhodospirillaceae bacterium]